MIAKRIALIAADLGSVALNTLLITPVNKALGWLGVRIPKACIRKFIIPEACDEGGLVPIESLLGCSPALSTIAYQRCAQHTNVLAHKTEVFTRFVRCRCYFARQEAICLSTDDTYDNYQDLFKAPDTDELTKQYEDIVGDSFTVVDPTFQAVFESLDNTVDAPDVAAAKEICDANLWESMALDKVRKLGHTLAPSFRRH